MIIRVATYYTPKPGKPPKLSHISAYTRWYNPNWQGCVEYDVEAKRGTEAKLIARERRLAELSRSET